VVGSGLHEPRLCCSVCLHGPYALNEATIVSSTLVDAANDTLFANGVYYANLANSDADEATGLGAGRKVLLRGDSTAASTQHLPPLSFAVTCPATLSTTTFRPRSDGYRPAPRELLHARRSARMFLERLEIASR
jgi:hypothetical protein